MSKTIKYYVSGNTAKGFYSFLENNLQDIEKIYVLRDAPIATKADTMQTIAEMWNKNDYNVEYLQSPFFEEGLDGIINIDLKLALIDGNIKSTEDENVEEISFITAWDAETLRDKALDAITLNYKARESYIKAYDSFADALKIHDEWEKIYIDNMNFERANELAEEVIEQIINDKRLNKSSKINDRFLGAATPEGPKDFIEDLTKDITKRYFMKGRPGTGKSTLLKKLVKAASGRGFDLEIYHCGFAPDSIDMVILRELDICIFDSTAPHEYFPSCENDETIDMYKEIIVLGTDEKYAKELEDISTRYKECISKANEFLKEGKALSEQLEELYISVIDSEKIKDIKEALIKEISDF